MKKIFALTLGLTVLMSLFSCSKEDFDSKYYNPSKTTTVTCDKLLSGVLYVGCEQYKSFGYNTYWRLYTWEGFFAQLTQQRGFNNNSGGVYFIQDGWATDRWNNFYETLAQFRLLQDAYEKSADQETDGIFVACAEVFVLDQLSQLVDVFGPVPYSKAGYLGITGDLASSYPAYDNDEELYGMMLDRLGELYNTINGYASSPSAIVSAKMKAQDFLNKGDLDKWLRYANSLRLRLATHVAAQGSLTGKAKTVIAECAGRKLADSMENGIFGAVDVLTNNSGMFWEWYRDGFAGDGKNVTASQKLIDAMQITGSDDPRLKVIYNPNAAGKFVGKHVGEKKADQDAADTKGWSDRVYATLDSVTFMTNSCMKNPVVSPAETWFLLAEARQAYGLSGSAEQAFKNGVHPRMVRPQHDQQGPQHEPVHALQGHRGPFRFRDRGLRQRRLGQVQQQARGHHDPEVGPHGPDERARVLDRHPPYRLPGPDLSGGLPVPDQPDHHPARPLSDRGEDQQQGQLRGQHPQG